MQVHHVKTKGRFSHKVQPNKNQHTVKGITPEQREKLQELGLDGLTSIQQTKINKNFALFTMSKYNPTKQSFKLPDGNYMKISPIDFHRVYGLPMGKKEVTLKKLSLEEAIDYALQVLLELEPPASNGRVKLLNVEHDVSNAHTIELWIKLFWLLITGGLFSPFSNPTAELNMLEYLQPGKIKHFKEYNWCKFFFDYMNEGLK
ncbi:unnamed protein product [Linum trigynum]|uniref:Uncharacterized protein n=1 Tax=Linum trigynum TaxID=586398 RepID=A0AAV2GHI8_9ROSI